MSEGEDAELFVPGDLVRWRTRPWAEPRNPELDADDPIIKTFRDFSGRLHENYGDGPFLVIRVAPNPEWRPDDDPRCRAHPQIVFVASQSGMPLPAGNAEPESLGGDWFQKIV